MADFSDRVKQLQKVAQGANSGGAKELKVIMAPLCRPFTQQVASFATWKKDGPSFIVFFDCFSQKRFPET